MAKKKSTKKPSILYNKMAVLQTACAIQRVLGVYVPSKNEICNRSILIECFITQTEANQYPITDEDIEMANRCINHFQNLAIKYLADTISQTELSTYLAITAEEIEEKQFGYIAMMPHRMVEESKMIPIARAIRMSKGPIQCSVGEIMNLDCKIINASYVNNYGFWGLLAITSDNHAISFTCGTDKFKIGNEYHIIGKVMKPVFTDYCTDLECTRLHYVRTT